MKLVSRRRPTSWSSLTLGLFFTVLAVYALTTGDAFVPGRHGSPSKDILAASDPRGYAFWTRAYVLLGAAGLLLAFIRVPPIEESWRGLKERSRATVHAKGLDSKPAPVWAYAFLAAFLALIIWIGWKTMYSE